MSHDAQFVVAAYAVIWVALLLYIVMLGARTARLGRDAELMARLVREHEGPDDVE
ncbi:MAG: CcmD family protein [Thermoleophilia bacterium]